MCAADFLLKLDPARAEGKHHVGMTNKTQAWGCPHISWGTHPCVYALLVWYMQEG